MKNKFKNFIVTPIATPGVGNASYHAFPQHVQNIFMPGFMREVDRYRVKAVVNDGLFPFFVLSGSSLGYIMKLSFVNGKAWDEARRSKFFASLEEGLRLDSQEALVEYTFSFSTVRRPMKAAEFDRFNSDNIDPITEARIDYLKEMAENLEVQGTDFYFGVTASPADMLKGHKYGYFERTKAIWNENFRLSMESNLLEDVIPKFAQKVKQLLALFSKNEISAQCPTTEKDLLLMARKAWRPNYEQATGSNASNASADSILRSLKEDAFSSVGDFLTKGLRMEEYESHWISDGCFNMLFSMEDAPDPDRVFSSYECDGFLSLGKTPGGSNIPYFGTHTVAFSVMTKLRADKAFALKNAFAQGTRSNRKGYFEDKRKNKEADDIERMQTEFTEGNGDMVMACVMYQLSIPLEHLTRFYDSKLPELELITLIGDNVRQQLGNIGLAKWRLESSTYYPPYMNSMPGAIRSTRTVKYLPQIKLPLDGALHLIPFFSTVGPESLNSPSWWGSNYFITDENGIFPHDHFSEKIGDAANYTVCGPTGSGKSVVVQSLAMMTAPLEPNIMVLDFGGGNLGSWTKLCAVMDGVELKFGSANPPLINPFQLSSEDSFPNQQKKKLIAIALGLEDNTKTMLMIDTVYKYLRGDDSPFIDNEARKQELISRCPAFSKFTYEEAFEILKLGSGYSRPGEKGSASIKITLELLLADDVNENGPTNNVWASFSIDDITEAIMRLFEEFRPPLGESNIWPTLTDFRNTLEVMQKIRKSGTSSNKWGQPEIFNYGLLMSRLTNYCVGDGYDSFLDGQTNVAVLKKKIVNGIERDMPAKFILADMAGISDKRKLALYMIVINDFMTNVLYNSKDTRGIMIRDEVWFFMRSKIAAPYLEADYRLARKYGFSVMSIAQQFTDFKNEVIKNNTQIWVVCNLGTTEQINAADAEFKFSDAERALFEQKLMGFKIERHPFTGKVIDAYARIMIFNKSGKYFIKNKISRLERWITTTNPNETFVFNFVKEAKMRGKPVIDIIKWLCTEEYLKDKDIIAIVKKAKRKMPRM